MKISTKVFTENQNLFNSILNSQNQFFKSICLDFTNKLAYSFNNTDNLRVKFEYELNDKEEVPKPLFIDGKLFTNLCKLTNDISYDDSKNLFSIGKDTYKIPFFRQDEYDFIEFDDIEIISTIKVNLNKDLSSLIKTASQFMCQTAYSSKEKSLNGIFIRNNRCIASDTKKFVNLSLPVKIDDLDINSNVLKFLVQLEDKEVTISKNENIVKMSFDSIDLIIVNSELQLPPIEKEGFISSYEHNNKVIVNKNELLSELLFLEDFLRESGSEKLYIIIRKENILLQVKENTKDIYVDKEFVFKTIQTEQDEVEFPLNVAYLKMALSSINSETIDVRFDDEKIGIKLSANNEPSDSFVVLIKMI